MMNRVKGRSGLITSILRGRLSRRKRTTSVQLSEGSWVVFQFQFCWCCYSFSIVEDAFQEISQSTHVSHHTLITPLFLMPLQFQPTPTMFRQTQNTILWHQPTSPPSRPILKEGLAASWPRPPLLSLWRRRQEAVARLLLLHLHPLWRFCNIAIVADEQLILCPLFQVAESNFPLYTAQFNNLSWTTRWRHCFMYLFTRILYIPETNHWILTGDRIPWRGFFLAILRLKQTLLQARGLRFRQQIVVLPPLEERGQEDQYHWNPCTDPFHYAGKGPQGKTRGAQWRNHPCESVFQRLLKAVAV